MISKKVKSEKFKHYISNNYFFSSSLTFYVNVATIPYNNNNIYLYSYTGQTYRIKYTHVTQKKKSHHSAMLYNC